MKNLKICSVLCVMTVLSVLCFDVLEHF